MQRKPFNFAPQVSLHIWKCVILPFGSLFWLQRSLVFVGNIYAISFFFSLLYCTGAGSFLWQCYHHWLHQTMSFWQLLVQPVTWVLSWWQPFHFSEPPRIIGIVGQSHCDFSLCVVPLLLLSFCMLLSFSVMFVYFMFSISDNSSCGYCFCWLYMIK